MRWIAALLMALWIGCGSSDHGDDGPDACVGLQCQVVNCAATGRPATSISGTVFAPNGRLPLFGVTVYVPNTDPGAFPEGAQCSRCASELPGDPIAHTVSDSEGRFTLTGAPSGTDIPLVITAGKWRRRVTIPVVSACSDTPMPGDQTSLPKQKTEGDLPKIAMVTGNCDALECLARKLGIADSEFTNDAGDGRVHLFASNGASKTVTNELLAPATGLWGSVDKLKQYDLALFSCECTQRAYDKPQPAMDALKAYADLGGRVFLSHFHSIWISGETGNPTHAPQEWPAIASCNVDATPTGTGVIDQLNNPSGAAFASWMVNVMGSSVLGQLPIAEAKQTCSSLDGARASRWVYLQSGASEIIQNFQFTTPNEIPGEKRCGKVVFSDMHVSSGSTSSPTVPFPGGCDNGPMSPQEKALAFMFFDIAGCVGPLQ
jgi:hypothetical protein